MSAARVTMTCCNATYRTVKETVNHVCRKDHPLTTPLLVTTAPREIEPRWIHAGDQVAVMATHYDPAHEVTPVRTVDLARIGDDRIVTWWLVTTNPAHPDPAEVGRRPYPLSGFLLTLSPGDEVPAVELFATEHEQLVIREQVTVEPWDIECRGLDGRCYLPAGHMGGCDPGTGDDFTAEGEPLDPTHPAWCVCGHAGCPGTPPKQCAASLHIPFEGEQCERCGAVGVVFDDDDPAGAQG